MEINISDINLMQWIPDLLYPVIDKLIYRKDQMLEKHLQSFIINDEFIKYIAKNEVEIEEYYRFVVFMEKNAISNQGYRGTEFCFKEMQEKNKKRLPHESPHDGHPSVLAGRLGTLYWRGTEGKQGQNDFNDLVRPFVNIFYQMRSNEIDCFHDEIYLKFEPNSISSRVKLAEILLKSWGNKLGFSVNKRLTRSKKLVLTKPLNDNLVSFWGIDIGKIELPVGPIRNHQQLLRPQTGPEFSMIFGVLDKKKVKSLTLDNDFTFFLRFKNFFPIETGLNYWTNYKRFYNLKELEAMVNINATLYEILMNDLENPFVKR